MMTGANHAVFDVIRLMADAESRNQLVDWGAEEFNEPLFRKLLEALVTAVNDEARLNARGTAAADLRLRGMLDARLWFVEDRRRRPEIANERIVRPLFVLGLPRTGSSFLQALLAQDPTNNWTTSAQLYFPAPHPGECDGGALRKARTDEIMAALGMFDPIVQTLHPWGDKQPEECIFASELMGWSEQLPACWRVPTYNRLRAQMPTEAFQMHRQVLQTLQHGSNRQRFVLKSPGHLFRLPELFATYPDAMVVQTHRDPAKVLPSMAAFVAALRAAGSDEPVRADKIAATNLKAFAAALGAVTAFRRTAPEARQIHDAHFVDIVADPIGAVRTVYDRFNLNLSHEAVTAMQAWLADDDNKTPRGRHSLGQYGLTEEQVDEYFESYINDYGIARER
jgi:Sulfotransferase family